MRVSQPIKKTVKRISGPLFKKGSLEQLCILVTVIDLCCIPNEIDCKFSLDTTIRSKYREKTPTVAVSRHLFIYVSKRLKEILKVMV